MNALISAKNISVIKSGKKILNELSAGSALFVINKMKQYKFSDDLCKEVINNWNNLRRDLEAEGVLFE